MSIEQKFVYVVSRGWAEDYQVLGHFSTEQAALYFMKRMGLGKDEDDKITKFEVDKPFPKEIQEGNEYYSVSFRSDGSLAGVLKRTLSPVLHDIDPSPVFMAAQNDDHPSFVYLYAKTPDEAVDQAKPVWLKGMMKDAEKRFAQALERYRSDD
jgi:hypothetical protein